MKLPKNPIWPTMASWRFEGEGGEPGGGETPHWAGDADHQKWAAEKGFKDSASVVKAHRELTSKHWAGDNKELQNYVDTKGYKDAASITSAYRDLEKKLGTMIPAPADDANNVDYEKFASKLRGRNLGAYTADLPKDLPEDTYDENLGNAMKQAAFDIGVPPRMFKQLWDQFWKAQGAQLKMLDDEGAKNKAEDEKTMRLKWGKDYDANLELATRAMEKVGVKGLFEQLGIHTHPLLQVAFHQMSEFLGEMKPPDAKDGKEGEEEMGWFTEYPSVGKNKASA